MVIYFPWLYILDKTKSISGCIFPSVVVHLFKSRTMELKEYITLELVHYEGKWLWNFLLGIPLGIQPTYMVSCIAIA